MLGDREELKTRLGITGTDYDTVLDNILLSAEKAVKNFLGRTYIQAPDEDIIEHQSGDGESQRIFTREYPIISVSSLKIDNEEIPARTSLDDDGYVITDAEYGVIQLVGYYCTPGVNNIEITYKPGWQNVPADIIEAIYRIATALWNHRDVVGLESQSVDGLSQKAVAVIDKSIKQLLQPYRRIKI